MKKIILSIILVMQLILVSPIHSEALICVGLEESVINHVDAAIVGIGLNIKSDIA